VEVTLALEVTLGGRGKAPCAKGHIFLIVILPKHIRASKFHHVYRILVVGVDEKTPEKNRPHQMTDNSA